MTTLTEYATAYVNRVLAAMTDEQYARFQAGDRVRVELGDGTAADVEKYRPRDEEVVWSFTRATR